VRLLVANRAEIAVRIMSTAVVLRKAYGLGAMAMAGGHLKA
jgi:acetyl/propionyl-CoA carboxylase alpha subunit